MKKILLLLMATFALAIYSNSQTKQASQLKLNIFTIGDSNGTFEFSWPQQLKKMLPQSTVVNRSISGNTIGFDNLGRVELNTLKNIDRYLGEAYGELGQGKKFDYILVNLGTNDTKVVFVNQQAEVIDNLGTLIQSIRNYLDSHQKQHPTICIVTPSPMDEQKANLEKYGGGDLRVQKNNKLFKGVAEKYQVDFIDTYTPLKDSFPEKTSDGVHLNEKGQVQLATEIVHHILGK